MKSPDKIHVVIQNAGRRKFQVLLRMLTHDVVFQAGAVKSLQKHYNMSMATVMGASAGINN